MGDQVEHPQLELIDLLDVVSKSMLVNQSDVVLVNKGEPSHKVVDPIEQRVGLHLEFALLLGQLIEYDIISIIGQI